jgi:uncharacterized membrane protein
MSPEILTFLLAASPISELRGAIPVAIGIYQFPIVKALSIAIVGNLLPIPFILWGLEPFSKWLRARSKPADRFFAWLFARTRTRFVKTYELYADLGLAIFVAIPLPITGAWTGAVAAFLFGIPPKRALPFIALGVLGAATIVTLSTLGVLRLF